MRCLSVAAVALLSTALSASGTQQTKTRTPAPPSGQPSHQDLTSSTTSGSASLKAAKQSPAHRPSVLTGAANLNPAKAPVRTDGPSHHSFVSGGSDTCATATAISGNGPFNGDNVGATTDGPNNCGLMANDVWYNWTAPASGMTNISLCGSGYDTVISVYDTSACTGALLACDDDSSCGLQSQVNVNVTGGNVYKIQVGGFNGSTGSYSMNMSLAPTCPCSGNPPENEANCGIPTDTVNGGCNSTPPVYSSIACGGSVCGTGAWNGSIRDTDWYQFTVATTQSANWTVTAEFPVVVGLLDNNCPPALLSFVNGPACTATTALANVAAGTYVAFVAPDFNGPTFPCSGSNSYAGTLTCGASCAPPEDACASAIAISGLGPFTGSTQCCSTDGPDPCGVLMTNDVWYDWTCGASGITTFSLCGSTYDTSIAIYDTNACQGAVLSCNDDFCNFQSQTTANVTAGNVYKIQIGGFSGATGSYTLSISAPVPPCPCSGHPPENEPNCGLPDTTNGGCNSSPPVYSQLACGGSVCGTGAWNGSTRDTDWYQFTLTGNATVTWTVTAEFPVVTGLLDNLCPPTILDFDFGSTCAATVSTAALTPGTYVAFTAPDFGGPPFACTTGNTYTGVLSCGGNIESYCSPDGSIANCPCANGAPGAGCANSDHTGGALLTGTGNASLGTDTVSLSSTQSGTIGHHSSSLALIFQGHDSGSFITYGDGVRCITSPLKRLFKFTPANAVTLTAPSASSIPPTPATISGQSAALGDPLVPGDIRGYQLLYRDPVLFCSPQSFNASNGIRVTW
jgi:hypothetical protein